MADRSVADCSVHMLTEALALLDSLNEAEAAAYVSMAIDTIRIRQGQQDASMPQPRVISSGIS